MTNDECRAYLAERVSYRDIEWQDLLALDGYLHWEYVVHALNGSNMQLRPPARKKGEPRIEYAHDGGILCASLCVSGRYFSSREAVTFNPDGFIGIAGWADGTNVKPFIRGLVRWADEWMAAKKERENANGRQD